MKANMNWLSKPVTWGGYLKLCGIMGIISTAVCSIEMCIVWQPTWLTNLVSFITKPFAKKEIYR